jgi:inner membrane transporter RhtA
VTTVESGRSAIASRAMRRVPAVVLVLLGIALFQLGAVLATELFARLGPAAATLLRLVFASAIMAAMWHPLPRRLARPQLRAVLLFGAALGTMNLCFYEAIARIPLGMTVTIQFAGPLAVAVIGRRRALDLVWVAMAAAGIVALIAPGGSEGDAAGYAFAALAAVAWAGYIVGSARLGTVFDDTRGLALGMIAATAVPLVPGIVGGAGAELSLAVIPLGIAVALLSSVIPHTLDNEALRRLPANVFGVLMSLEPVIASLLGWAFLGQLLSFREWVGVALVATAAVGIMRYRADAVPEHA